jgi:hypothetical protein
MQLRVSPARRATTNTRAGSPSRPGTVAETITPIIVARAETRRLIRLLSDAPRRITYQHSARAINDADNNANVSATNPGLTFVSVCRLRERFKRVSANAASPTPPATIKATMTGLTRQDTCRPLDEESCVFTLGPGSDRWC